MIITIKIPVNMKVVLIALSAFFLITSCLTGWFLHLKITEYDSLQASYQTLHNENITLESKLSQSEADFENLQSKYNYVNNELTQIKELFPSWEIEWAKKERLWNK